MNNRLISVPFTLPTQHGWPCLAATELLMQLLFLPATLHRCRQAEVALRLSVSRECCFVVSVSLLCCTQQGSRDVICLGDEGMKEKKNHRWTQDLLGLGSLGSLLKKPQQPESSLCLLCRVEQRGRAIAYSWTRRGDYYIQKNKKVMSMVLRRQG